MGRAIAAVVGAEIMWAALFLGGSAVVTPMLPDLIVQGQPVTHTGLLLGFVIWSVVASVAAGFLCSAIRRGSPMKTVWVFACIQLAIGLVMEISAWDMTPAWYHIVFLALLVPATVWGGSLKSEKP